MQKKIRLDKFLCDMNIGTRTDVKQYIKAKQVEVNDSIVTDSGFKVDTDQDTIKFQGKTIGYEKFVYYMLNKPQGVISATEDNLNETVLSLLKGVNTKGLFPVGRLDKDTEGLLVITNDGNMAHKLLSPKKHVDKKYYVELDSPVNDEEIKAIEEGIDIGDDKPCLPCNIEKLDNGYYITIKEGRYHQIKRMFMVFSHKVTFLKRISMGGLILDDKLKPGDYRALTETEIDLLKQKRDL